MAQNKQAWEEFGRDIQVAIDRAISSSDYKQLNQQITQLVGRAVDLGGETIRNVVDAASKPPKIVDAVPDNTRPVVVMKKQDIPALYGKTAGKTVVGILKTVGGGVLTLTTGITSLLVLIYNLAISGIGLFSGGLVFSLAALAGSVHLLRSGIQRLTMMSRFDTYKKTIGQKTYCQIKTLAKSVGKNVTFVRKELGQMIDSGLFLEGHFDKKKTCLITSDETFRYFEENRLLLEESQKQTKVAEIQNKPVPQEAPKAKLDPQVKEVLDRGNAFISEIRKCNDNIPGEDISAKISHMEMIVQQIFERAQKHPEIVPDLKKLMDYYLPMTVKLLNAYADMDAQPVQGETIQTSKREIENTLDTLNQAFEKLLDSIFRDTALDVSSDISVLNTLLAQEGLTEDELTKMKQQNQ